MYAQKTEYADRVVSNITTDIETIRPRSVGFTINGAGRPQQPRLAET